MLKVHEVDSDMTADRIEAVGPKISAFAGEEKSASMAVGDGVVVTATTGDKFIGNITFLGSIGWIAITLS